MIKNIGYLNSNFLTQAKKLFLYLAIFLLAFGIRVLFINSNPTPQVDEAASFFISTPNKKDPEGELFKTSENYYKLNLKQPTYKGKDLNNLLFQPEHTIEGLFNDLSSIRLQKLDRPHPSLYYTFARIWNHNLGEFHKDIYLQHLRSLNLVFFIFSFFYMYKLLSLIKKDDIFISTGLIFAFLNVGTIVNCALAREYALQETLFIVTTYIGIKLLKQINENKTISIKQSILYSIGFSLFLVSGYFAFIYFALLFILFFTKIIFNKSKHNLIIITLTLLTTFIMTIVLCPNYFDFKTENCHYSTILSHFMNIASYNNNFLNESFIYLIKYLFYPVLVSLITFCTFFNIYASAEKNELNIPNPKQNLYTILFIVFAWVIIAMNLAPYQSLRFISPALPVLAIIYPLIMNQRKKISKILLVLIFLTITFKTITSPNWLDNDRIRYTPNLSDKIYPIVLVEPNYFTMTYSFFNIPPNTVVHITKEIPQQTYKLKRYKLVCASSSLPDLKPLCTKIFFNVYIHFIFNK